MIDLHDTAPVVDVPVAEYVRLLGYPRGRILEGRAQELADWARDWYAAHGRPWLAARQAGALDVIEGGVRLGGETFSSGRLARLCRNAGAVDAVVSAVSAGPELEQEAQRRWQDGKPDEYFFLEVYGSAVVEHLVTLTGARLCAWADTEGLAVLPHDSPGYPDWTIADQDRLLAMIACDRAAGPLPLDVLESGMLRPKKSLLAVFGLTPMTDHVRRLTDLVPCEQCAFQPCQFRRAPYRHAPAPADPELGAAAGTAASEPRLPLDVAARYSVNTKALHRWAAERLTLDARADGAIDARFRYEGTTCTNMGRALEFHYHVRLGSRDEGYPILEQRCEPAPNDRGHAQMCRYLTDAASLMQAIHDERPLLGRPLDDVIGWSRASAPAGCYCEPHSRAYKWGLVLETLHFALARQDADAARETTS
jgi:hypothetical protein